MPNPQNSKPMNPEERFAPENEPKHSGRDAPPAAQYPYTDLRPEARGPVTPDDPGALVGDDVTATFDQGPSNPTEHASSEALSAATSVARDSASEDDSDMHALHTEDAADDNH